jgi:lysophospholipase L1-like esterase
MQAMHGSARPVRSRGRLIGCSMALVLALGALFASSASAAKTPTQTYLALGDSLAFGYSQQLFNENEKTGESPTAFENGYANVYLKFANKQNPTPYQLVNNGCPGETTDSFIGNGPVAAGLEASAFEAHGEAPCAYHYASGLPLHHEYGGTKSQLENALETIGVEAALGTPVNKLTLNIGANDELRQVKACEKEVGEEYGKEGKSKYGANPTEAVENCLKAHVKGLIEHIVKNTAASVYAIRNGSSFGGVNYTGPITFQAGYDPYGNLVPNGEPQIENGKPQKELLPGSVPLAQLINAEVGKAVTTYGGEGTCIADPLPRFNPISVKSGIKTYEKEEFRLQTWTNMANTTEFEGKKNGPDIHPTPTGYKQLAVVMRKACGV